MGKVAPLKMREPFCCTQGTSLSFLLCGRAVRAFSVDTLTGLEIVDGDGGKHVDKAQRGAWERSGVLGAVLEKGMAVPSQGNRSQSST
jgi:hypothetical protein